MSFYNIRNPLPPAIIACVDSCSPTFFDPIRQEFRYIVP